MSETCLLRCSPFSLPALTACVFTPPGGVSSAVPELPGLGGDRAAGLQLQLSSNTGSPSAVVRALFHTSLGAFVATSSRPGVSLAGPFQMSDGTGKTCHVVCVSLHLDSHVPGSAVLVPGQSKPRDRRWLQAWQLLSLLLLRLSVPTPRSPLRLSLCSAMKPSVFFLSFPRARGFWLMHETSSVSHGSTLNVFFLFFPRARGFWSMHETSSVSPGSTLKMRSTGCSSWLSRTRQGCPWTPPPSSCTCPP